MDFWIRIPASWIFGSGFRPHGFLDPDSDLLDFWIRIQSSLIFYTNSGLIDFSIRIQASWIFGSGSRPLRFLDSDPRSIDFWIRIQASKILSLNNFISSWFQIRTNILVQCDAIRFCGDVVLESFNMVRQYFRQKKLIKIIMIKSEQFCYCMQYWSKKLWPSPHALLRIQNDISAKTVPSDCIEL